jgi:integrase/recombinase XerD
VDADIEASTGCHTFRGTGITDYLSKCGKLETAQPIGGRSNAKTIYLYDRRDDDINVSEVERLAI